MHAVVVLPFVPVTATTLPGQNQDASSISPTISTPIPRAALTISESGPIPGLRTSNSFPSRNSVPWRPILQSIPSLRRLRKPSSMSASVRTSPAVTSAPMRFSRSEAATPLTPIPATTTLFPSTLLFTACILRVPDPVPVRT